LASDDAAKLYEAQQSEILDVTSAGEVPTDDQWCVHIGDNRFFPVKLKTLLFQSDNLHSHLTTVTGVSCWREHSSVTSGSLDSNQHVRPVVAPGVCVRSSCTSSRSR
jgi:hypothetical protein